MNHPRMINGCHDADAAVSAPDAVIADADAAVAAAIAAVAAAAAAADGMLTISLQGPSLCIRI